MILLRIAVHGPQIRRTGEDTGLRVLLRYPILATWPVPRSASSPTFLRAGGAIVLLDWTFLFFFLDIMVA